MSLSRYPGAQPFEQSHRTVFFGRGEALDKLRRQVKLAPLTVLHGKSGTGKSSILNAGLLPLVDEEGHYDAVRIRFNAWLPEGAHASPTARTRASVAALGQGDTFLGKLLSEDESLWRKAKDQLIRRNGERGLLLIFDQFEELFTYPAEDILAFRRELAEALQPAAPQRYWDV
ncbi:MAG: ATP-binding protein, partial [Lewinella sp.]|nr:ATP-binding protein [Lewinella sp.]